MVAQIDSINGEKKSRLFINTISIVVPLVVAILLAMPNAFTLLVFALGSALIHIQVRLEEEHLMRTHGNDYQAYAHLVRRWL